MTLLCPPSPTSSNSTSAHIISLEAVCALSVYKVYAIVKNLTALPQKHTASSVCLAVHVIVRNFTALPQKHNATTVASIIAAYCSSEQCVNSCDGC